ncbi:tetratricopeptide repeat protein [Salinihabitans flavidus]|nr:hypothetical protein [Salinihabitans flavidus]
MKSYLKPIVAAAFAAIAFLGAAGAQEASGDDLLAQLREAGPEEAVRLEREIRHAWSKSGSAAADLLLKRGRDAMERQEVHAAIEHFTALTDHAPDFAQGWVERARAYAHAELFGPAIGDLEQALALEPAHFQAIMGLASIMEALDEREAAHQALQEVEAIHPHHPDLDEAMKRLAPGLSGRSL